MAGDRGDGPTTDEPFHEHKEKHTSLEKIARAQDQ
jgi:hypothetical protein